MEHQQNQQQTIAKPLASEDDDKQVQTYISHKKIANSYFLQKLIQRHPLLVLLGVSAFLVVAIYSSVVSIFQISLIKEETKSLPVATNNSSLQHTSTNDSLPVWLLGAIAIGATVGGVAIAKRFSNSSSELSQFFLQFNSARQPQPQFPPLRQSILSLPALTLSEPKPTWAESSTETELQLNIYSETDEFIILVEESLDNEEESFLEAVELTAEEKNLIFENIAFEDTLELSSEMRSPLEDLTNPKTLSNSAPENDAYSPHTISVVNMLDLRQKVSLATLLKIND